MYTEHSLVFKVLKAGYFPSCGILNMDLGSEPSFMWRSLH